MSVARANSNGVRRPQGDDEPQPASSTSSTSSTSAKPGSDSTSGAGPFTNGADGLDQSGGGVRTPAFANPTPQAKNESAKTEAPSDSSPIPIRSADVERRLAEIKKKSPEDYKKILAALTDLTSVDVEKTLKALALLAKQFPQNLKGVFDHFGLKDSKVCKLASQPEALKALSTFFDPKASKLELAQAALELAKETAEIFKPEDLRGALGPILNALPVGAKVLEAIITFSDDKKSAVEKAKAGLELAGALREFAGELSPGLQRAMSKLAGSFGAMESIFTLVDPKASLGDKAQAAAKLLAALPDLKQDFTRFKELLKGAGVKDVDLIYQAAAKAGGVAKDTALDGLSSAVAKGLSAAELEQCKGLATKLGGADLGKVLAKLEDPAAVKQLIAQLTKLEPDAGKRLLKLTKDMEMDALGGLLKQATSAESLGRLAAKLDDFSTDTAKKLLKGMNEDALKALFKLTDHASADALRTVMKGLGPVIDTVGPEALGKAVGLLDQLLGKMGVAMTKEAAEKVLKTLLKILPAVGAVPGLIDAGKYAREAVNLHGQNKDLAMFATVGAGLNAADSVIGLVLDATGVGVAVDLGIGVLFGVAELALDLSFDAEKKKMQANPQGYQAPDWMKAVNLGFAAASGPSGLTTLIANYGIQGTAELIAWGAKSGVKVAGKLLEELGKLGAQGVVILENLAHRGVTAAADFLVSSGHALRDVTNGEVTIAGRKVDSNPLW